MTEGQETYNDVSNRLDVVIALMLRMAARANSATTAGVKRNLGEEAVFLRSFKIANPEIAKILGSTPDSVKTLVSRNQKGHAKDVKGK